LQYKIADHNML